MRDSQLGEGMDGAQYCISNSDGISSNVLAVHLHAVIDAHSLYAISMTPY